MASIHELHRGIHRSVLKGVFQKSQGQEGMTATNDREAGTGASVRKALETQASRIMETQN